MGRVHQALKVPWTQSYPGSPPLPDGDSATTLEGAIAPHVLAASTLIWPLTASILLPRATFYDACGGAVAVSALIFF